MLLRTSSSFNYSMRQHAGLSIKPYKKSSKKSNIHIAKGQKCLSALAVAHHK
jgi:hypothetical protein